jgi:hypothetical protein
VINHHFIVTLDDLVTHPRIYPSQVIGFKANPNLIAAFATAGAILINLGSKGFVLYNLYQNLV